MGYGKFKTHLYSAVGLTLYAAGESIYAGLVGSPHLAGLIILICVIVGNAALALTATINCIRGAPKLKLPWIHIYLLTFGLLNTINMAQLAYMPDSFAKGFILILFIATPGLAILFIEILFGVVYCIMASNGIERKLYDCCTRCRKH